MSSGGVNLALFLPDAPFLALGKTPSNSLIASSCIPSIICE